MSQFSQELLKVESSTVVNICKMSSVKILPIAIGH